MSKLHAPALSLALVAAALGGACSSKVVLTRVGTTDPQSSNQNCDPKGERVTRGATLNVAILGRRDPPGGGPLTGTLHLGGTAFQMTPPINPAVVYRDDGSSPENFTIGVMNAAPFGVNFMSVVAVDDAGVESGHRDCRVSVERPSVRAEALTVNPAAPRAASPNVVTATIANDTDATVFHVPWSMWAAQSGGIASSGPAQWFATGFVSQIAAGQKASVTGTWAPVNFGTTYTLGIQVDSANTLGEADYRRADNVKSFNVAVNGRTVPVLVTQVLDYQKALDAGAQSSANLEPGERCDGPEGLYLGAQPDNWDIGGLNNQQPGVLLHLMCLNGSRSNPEAYKNFTLKNGWRVKSFEGVTTHVAYDDLRRVYFAGFHWITPPGIGTASPYLQVHLWTNGGTPPPLAIPDGIVFGVKVVIEGPADTNPYQ